MGGRKGRKRRRRKERMNKYRLCKVHKAAELGPMLSHLGSFSGRKTKRALDWGEERGEGRRKKKMNIDYSGFIKQRSWGRCFPAWVVLQAERPGGLRLGEGEREEENK